MDRIYMQNWLIWCLHQTTVAGEHGRLQESVRMAALQLQLPILPALGMEYTDPGPVDSASLSMAGHPLLLDATVQIYDESVSEPILAQGESSSYSMVNGGRSPVKTNNKGFLAARTLSLGLYNKKNTTPKPAIQQQPTKMMRHANGSALERVRSAPNNNGQEQQQSSNKYCVAVPERFYELLRSVHGVICDDFATVSFQSPSSLNAPFDEQQRWILHHHSYQEQLLPASSVDDEGIHQGLASSPRPIEFRRQMIQQPIEKTPAGSTRHNSSKNPPVVSLMERLMLEEQAVAVQLMVEVHPIKLLYFCTSSSSPAGQVESHPEENGTSRTKHKNGNSVPPPPLPSQGFVLVSRNSPAVAALVALQKVVTPNQASQSVRLWSKWDYNATNAPATAIYDGYELVDMEMLSSEAPNPALQPPPPLKSTNGHTHATATSSHHRWTVGAWVEQHHANSSVKELELLVEMRRTVNSPWPRAAYEFENRLQVGDLVDAQDVAGKWYEAVIRQVSKEDDTVLVHYVGWATKWDSKARRRKLVGSGGSSPAGVPSKVKAPAPLWSQSGRWREKLRLGDVIEVRDSSSIAERPKWYSGKVRQVGGKHDPPRPLSGGADLETYATNDDDEGEDGKKALLVLGRTQQILVEVEQERSGKASISPPRDRIINLSPTANSTDESLMPHPPYLRWVNLYGEEICKAGTHLKETKDDGPVTLKYEFDNSRKPVEVMKSHPTLGSGFMRESLRGTPPAPGSVGLHNLGNSCFLNSTVQCLNHIEPLTQFFLQEKYSKDLNKRNPLGSGGNVAVAYASLLKKMWAGKHSILVPRLLKQTVANFAPQFDNSYQHDSHEFCQFLMDGLHEDLNRVKTKPYVEELEGFGMEDSKAAIESWRKHLLRHDSIIVDHCQGMHRSHLTCPQCGRESIKFDIYSSISLPLPTEKNRVTGTIKLEDCIEKFMEAEQLDERDAYYCPSCRRHVCALKLIALWSVPDILILHLKRFTFDTCMLSGGMLRSKVDNTVEFPINGLDLTKNVLGPIDPDAPPIFNLFGVSEHSGPTANSGHYTATIRNSVDGQWYRCNDSHVGLTSGEASITGGAYLLFYQRAKGITKWGGMHKVMKELGIDPYGGMDPIGGEGFRQVKIKKKKKG